MAKVMTKKRLLRLIFTKFLGHVFWGALIYTQSYKENKIKLPNPGKLY